MDQRLIAKRFARARNTYDRAAQVQRAVAAKMLRLVQAYSSGEEGRLMVEVECGTGIYSRLLCQELHPGQLLLNDLCPEMEACVGDLPARFQASDAECLPLPPQTHLITSCSALQWLVHPQRFFRHCHTSLANGGLLAFSTFGPDNMLQIRQLTGNGLTYLSLQELKDRLSPPFRLLHTEEERVTLCFDTPLTLLRHLKETGVTGTGKQLWTRRRLQAFCDGYLHRYATLDGHVILTYHPIYIVAQKTSETP